MLTLEGRRRLARKATDAPLFSDSLKRDPRAAIREELGVELPADTTIEIIEESELTRVFVMPWDILSRSERPPV